MAKRKTLTERIETGLALSGLDPLALAAVDAPYPDLTPPRWHVGCTYEGREDRVRRALEKSGLACYLPLRRTVTSYRKWTRSAAAPLFPGYIFIAWSGTPADWRRWALDGMTGMLHPAGNPNAPAVVPDDMIATIIRAEYEGCFLSSRRPRSRDYTEAAMHAKDLRVGDEAVIDDGKWANMIGLLKSAEPELRVAVLLEMMGRVVEVSVPLSKVSPV